MKPEIENEKCKKCWICIYQCPDSAIKKVEDGIEIDMDYCKGCGICAHECKFKAITMVVEEK